MSGWWWWLWLVVIGGPVGFLGSTLFRLVAFLKHVDITVVEVVQKTEEIQENTHTHTHTKAWESFIEKPLQNPKKPKQPKA